MKKKIFVSFFMAVAVIILYSILDINIVRAEVITGNEENVNWSFDEKIGILTFSGSGRITDKWKNEVESYEEKVKNIIIGENITTIGNDAFCHCKYLEKVIIPNNVENIEHNAFGDCSYMEAILVEENPNYCSIDGVLFSKDKTELVQYPAGRKEQKYEVPNTVTTINSYAFYESNHLKEIILPDSVTCIGVFAFRHCRYLENIALSNNITIIECGAFYACFNLKNIIIPSNVISIGDQSFYACHDLKEVIIPNNVTVIASTAFAQCTSLETIKTEGNQNYCSVNGVLFNKDKTELLQYPAGKNEQIYEIPNTVINIKNTAFMSNKLEKIIIPDSVVSIGISAFAFCKNLDTVVIPKTVTNISSDAFFECDNLKKIYCKSESVALNYAIEKNFSYIIDDTAPIIEEIKQLDGKLEIVASDEGVGLATNAYSINGKDWQERNIFDIKENNTYKIYVRDALYNIDEKEIKVTLIEDNNEKIENKVEENQNNTILEDQPQDKDNTQSPNIIPHTGTFSMISVFTLSGIIVFISYIKYKKIKF